MELEEANEASKVSSSQDGNDLKLNRVATLGVDALSKEVKYEKLAESEELDREVLEELASRKRIEALKKSDECLARDERKA